MECNPFLPRGCPQRPRIRTPRGEAYVPNAGPAATRRTDGPAEGDGGGDGSADLVLPPSVIQAEGISKDRMVLKVAKRLCLIFFKEAFSQPFYCYFFLEFSMLLVCWF